MSRLPALESSMTVKPQALRPPFFPASTSLIDPPNYDGGIPIRALEDGLRCIISPWEMMDIGDEVQLYWQNLTSPVATKTIQLDDEVDKPVVLRVPKSQVLDGDARPVFYRVIRRNQAPEDSEPKLTYLVKTTRPGGYDDNPEPGHSGFQYTFLTDISNGVDAGMADLGVQLRIEPYEHMTAFDRIVCRWGSQEVIHYPVTQAQVNDPLNNPIVITFTREVIERAGDGSRVVVTYQVIDCVGNYPDERDSWAPFSYVLVDLGGNRLDAPLVLMAGRPTNNIDLDQLGNDDVEVRVYTNTTDFKVGDSLRLTWTGTPAQGSPIVVGPLLELVDAVPFHYDFAIPNAAVKAIAQGWATVSYVRVRDGEPDRPSKNASVNVQGDISRLPAPSVAQAPGGTLPSNSPYATIAVPYFEGRRTGDLITIHCQGRRPGGGETYYSIPIIVSESDATNPITRDLPGSQIAPLDGGTLKLYYVVANDDLAVRSERESLPLELNVGVAAPDFNAPQITEAEGDVLLPENTPNGANVIAPFNVPSDTRAGDIVGLRWVGSVTGAHPLYEIPLSNQTAGKPVPFLVRAEHIHPNLNGTVTADYYRKRGAEMTRFSRERVWRVGGVELDLQPPSIRQASGNSLNPVAAKDLLTAVIPQGELLPDDLMSVTWTAAPGTSPEGSYTTPTRPISETGLEIALPNSVLAYNLGKTVTMTYSVTRGNTPAKTSAPLTLNVLNIPAQSPELPTPIIDAASNGELDVTTLTGNEPLYVTQWMFQRPGQAVWLRYDGTDTNGNATEEVVWEGAPHHSDQGLVIGAAYGWLQTLKDGSVVRITFMVNFDGVANEATAVKFPMRTYTVRSIELVVPTITSVKGSPSNVEIPDGDTTAETAVLLIGTASKGQEVEIFDDTTSKDKARADANTGIWTLSITMLAEGAHSYTAKALYGTGATSAARRLTVAEVDDFKSAPETDLTTIGQYVLSDKFRITLRAVPFSSSSLYVAPPRSSFPYRKIAIFPYVPYQTTTTYLTYELELRSGSARRVGFWMRYGNLGSLDDHMYVYFLNSTGQTLHSQRHNYAQENHGRELKFDSGMLNEIKTIRLSTTGQYMVGHFEITR